MVSKKKYCNINVEAEMRKLLVKDPKFIKECERNNKKIVAAILGMPDKFDIIDKQIEIEIKEQAHWLANKFSTRYGYTTTEELLLEMGTFVKNRMLDIVERLE